MEELRNEKIGEIVLNDIEELNDFLERVAMLDEFYIHIALGLSHDFYYVLMDIRKIYVRFKIKGGGLDTIVNMLQPYKRELHKIYTDEDLQILINRYKFKLI